MEHQKIANLLNDESNQPSKFRTRNWVEINDEARGTYSTDKQIKFKTSMLRSSLCDQSDAYILIKGNIAINNTVDAGANANNTNKKVIFKNCVPFTSCISKINNTQIDNAEYIDVVMPMYNLIEYSDNYSKTCGILFQFCRDVLAVDHNNGKIADITYTTTDSFNLKVKLIGQTGNNDTKDDEIMVPLKYLSNFWRTFEIPLINCEITLDLNWSENCIIVAANVASQVPTFSITDTKLYVPVVTL